MTADEMNANAAYQAYCEAQLMFALSWDELPGHRRVVWLAVAAALRDDTGREVQPWQRREARARCVEVRRAS
jgi:hypothetical protein